MVRVDVRISAISFSFIFFLQAFFKVYAIADIPTIHPIPMYEGKTAEYVYMLVNVIIEKFRYIIATRVLTGAHYENRHYLCCDCVSDAGLRFRNHAAALYGYRFAGAGREKGVQFAPAGC
ncbi:protein of unknown function [Enterobacter cancerogenus]|nr:protein of unknown function [Enterobacter cancerogenus]